MHMSDRVPPESLVPVFHARAQQEREMVKVKGRGKYSTETLSGDEVVGAAGENAPGGKVAEWNSTPGWTLASELVLTKRVVRWQQER
jgi:hypothetical protein